MVTFLLTDVEGSTRLWEERPEEMASALAAHDALLAEIMAAHNGALLKAKGEGDATFSVFDDPADAVAAALDAQRSLRESMFRVRIAIHTGHAEARDGDYFGPTVNRCARLRGAAHGGQVILSFVTRQLVVGRLPEGASLVDLGLHHLKDLTEPERVFQLCHDDVAADFPPLASLERRRHNLPPTLTSFIGRDNEVAAADDALAASRLVTLVGPGGAGKTRLALEVARRRVEAIDDGVWFVDLSRTQGPDQVVAALAAELGVREEPGRSLLDSVVKHVQDRSMLVVVDNCEHVLDNAAEVVDAILRAGPDTRVLATSRQRLGLPGERMHSVGGMDEAELLFEERASLTGATLSPDDREVVAEICRRLDHLPLAIELAAALTDRMSVADLARRLPDRLELLPSLAAAIACSYELLDDRARDAFVALSVLPAGFDLPAAEGVVGPDATSLVGRLVAASLVVHRHGRYSMLDSIRAYGAERLAGSGRIAEVNDALVRWARSVVDGGDYDYLDAEHGNLLAAIGWARLRAPDDALDLVNGLGDYWRGRGLWSLGRGVAEDVLSAAPETGTLRWATAMHHAGRLAARQGDLDIAQRRYLESLDVAERVGDDALVERNLTDLGRVAQVRSEMDEAREYFEAALSIAKQLDRPGAIASSLTNLGIVAHVHGDLAAARSLYEEARALLTDAGETDGLAAVTANLGMIQRLTGDTDGARRLFEEALVLARDTGDIPETAKVLTELSLLAIGVDDIDTARSMLEESVQITASIGNRPGEAACHYYLSEIARRQGDLESARAHAARALATWKHVGHRLGAAGQQVTLAEISYDEGDIDEARRLAREALDEFVELDAAHGIASALECLSAITAREDIGRAAQILGAVDAVRAAMGAHAASDPGTTAVRERAQRELGGEFAALFEAGKKLTPEEAGALADV